MLTSEQLTPDQRSLRAKAGAHALHAKYDSKKTTAKARQTFLSQFEKEVDPDGVLTLEERQRRAQHARKAYFAVLALKASRARREKAHAKKNEKPPVQAGDGKGVA